MQQQMESMQEAFENQMADAWKMVEKREITEQQLNDMYYRYTQE